jgi:hypothetical protein
MYVVIEQALTSLRASLRVVFEFGSPTMSFDWPVSDRTMSEIGGRILEDLVLQRIKCAAEAANPKGSVSVRIPSSGRTLEDFAYQYHCAAGQHGAACRHQGTQSEAKGLATESSLYSQMPRPLLKRGE